MKVAYIFPPPWNPEYPPYAMALFEGSTKYHHHEFFGFDLNVDLYHAVSDEDKELWKDQYAVRWNTEWERIVKQYSAFFDAYITRMLKLSINLYAFYTSVYSKHLAFFIAKKIKETNHKSAIIFGGPQCFPAYEHLAILENEFVDAICTGEGDSVWQAILESVSKNGNLSIDVPGIAYKGSDGTVIDGGVPELIDDLDTIPFADYSSIKFAKYGNGYQISTMTSRGCINTCAFCSERPNFYKYRHRSAENIVAEISKHLALLQRNGEAEIQEKHNMGLPSGAKLFGIGKEMRSIMRSGQGVSWLGFLRRGYNRIATLPLRLSEGSKKVVPYISFNDSLINGSPRQLERFCDMIIERGLKFMWGGMALLRKEMTKGLLIKMHKAGCHNLAWGLESGCQEVLTLMHKRFFTMDLAKKIIKDTYRVGIRQSAALIVGFPGETEEMFRETVEFVREYKEYFDVIGVQPMMIVRNSRVFEKFEEFGVDHENAHRFLEWQTKDASNNYETRLRRLELLNAVLKDKMLRIDK